MREGVEAVQRELIGCRRCGRLRNYCEKIASQKRRAYREQTYWGKPVPGFGDPDARLFIVGLAPGAHGGNRTGRLFTGDSSGTFLFNSMFRAGFSNLSDSVHRGDGLRLTDAYISAVVHCAPPANKPLPREIRNCRSYLVREFESLLRLRAVLVLGRIALDGYLAALRQMGRLQEGVPKVRFAHGASFLLSPSLPRLFTSYHPSRQNTQTGRLTVSMLDSVFSQIREFLG